MHFSERAYFLSNHYIHSRSSNAPPQDCYYNQHQLYSDRHLARLLLSHRFIWTYMLALRSVSVNSCISFRSINLFPLYGLIESTLVLSVYQILLIMLMILAASHLMTKTRSPTTQSLILPLFYCASSSPSVCH